MAAASLQAAWHAVQSGRLTEAETICRDLLAVNASDPAALQLAAMVQHRLGQLDAAQALFARSVELAPRNAEFRTNFALLLSARGASQQSIAELERALALDPRFRPARLALARISNQTARYEAADAHARKLIAANENDSEAWSALGTARFAMQRVSEARDAFERAVALAPGYGAARYGFAAVLCAQERAEEALVQADEAARLGVQHRELVLTRARALVQLDRYNEAEATLTAQLTKQPHDVESQFLLAQLRQVRGDADCARGFREAAARPDAPPEILVGYGDVARRVGDCALSERLMRDLIARHGRAPGWLSSLGTVLHELGRHEEAVDLTREAALAQPLDPTIAENLVAALLSAGAPREALPTIERFRAAAPDDQRWITYRIDVARQLGEDLFAQWCDFQRLVRATTFRRPLAMQRWTSSMRSCGRCSPSATFRPRIRSTRACDTGRKPLAAWCEAWIRRSMPFSIRSRHPSRIISRHSVMITSHPCSRATQLRRIWSAAGRCDSSAAGSTSTIFIPTAG